MPLSPRPLSIFNALKTRQSKQAVAPGTPTSSSSLPTTGATSAAAGITTAGSSAAGTKQQQPLIISAPISTRSSAAIAVAETMPPSSMDNRTRKLISYARTGSVGGTPPINAASQLPMPSQQPPMLERKRSDTPAVPNNNVPPDLAARQALAQQARIPIFKGTSFGSPPAAHRRHGSQGSLAQSSPPHASPPMRRTRTNSDTRDRAGEGGLWDSTTVEDTSTFSVSNQDWEQRRGAGVPLSSPPEHKQEATKFWAQAQSQTNTHVYREPLHPPQPDRAGAHRSQDLSPFVIGENGLINLVPGGHPGPSVTTINTSVQSGILHDGTASKDQIQAEPPYLAAAPAPQRMAPRTKLPLRDAKPRSSYHERNGNNYAEEDEVLSSSPTYESARHGYRKNEGLESKRTTEFADLEEVVDDPMDSDFSASSNVPPTEQPLAHRRTKAKAKPKGLLESSMPLLGTGGAEDKSRKRRRNSGDYKDNVLRQMRYEDLKKQAFDFNPAKPSAPIDVVTPEEQLFAKLRDHRRVGEAAQRVFFTEMSVADWEQAGDWFMDRFADVTRQLREARQARRAVVRQFETEIANREELVRIRTQSIGEKLGKMKEEGENMLMDKDI